MLTVWAVATGTKYTPDYLARLQAGVRRNLQQPFCFATITDQPGAIGGMRYAPDPALPGWWQKLALFNLTRHQDPAGQNLYIDLDSVIIGPLDDLVDAHRHNFLAMPRNWANSGHGGCQSSVMLWTGGFAAHLYDHVTPADMARLWGDQEWITQRLGPPGEGTITAIDPRTVVSYKYHCRDAGHPPAGARIVTFHGKPDPHEVPEAWVQRCWQ